MVGKLEKFTCLKEKSNSEELVNYELTNQLDSFAFAQNDRGRHSELDSESINVGYNNIPDKDFSLFTFHFSLKCAVNNQNHKVAFTLAEVLITLGIIGVVAAMTLPSLIQNYQEKVRVSQLKKAYATISNAYISVLNEEGDMSEWADVETWDDVTDKFAKYIINKVKVCKDAQGGCFAPIVRKDLTGNKVQNIANYSAIISSDGTVIAFSAQVPLEEAKSCSNLNYCFNIIVDINGDKLPNQFGIDTFIFQVGKEKILPRGASTTHGKETLCNPKGNSRDADGWYNGSGCAAWVLYNENMDYLKCIKGSQKYCNQKYYF